MSSISNTTKEWREETGEFARRLAGLVRHMAVTLTSEGLGALWQVTGHLLLDNVTVETLNAEVYSSGFYSRPAAGANAEAIVAFPGGAANPSIIATRDEALRKKMGQLAQNEGCMVNTLAGVYITAAGKVEARAAGGAAVPLATKADIDALQSWIATHLHSGVTTGAGVSGTPSSSPPAAAGTTVLKGQ